MDGPVRMCRACRARHPQSELSRWVIRNGQLVADQARRFGGRGIYSCSETCATQLQGNIPSIKRKR